MHNYSGSLVELPKKGKALIIADIHGNLTDFNKLMDIWKDFKKDDNHLVLIGDFIHAIDHDKDKSIEILESVKSNFEKDSNFHVLLGNHEWSVITSVAIYKNLEDLNSTFEFLLKQKFQDQWQDKLKEYQHFFRKLPLAVKTGNKVFMSHSGPAKEVNSIEDVIRIKDAGYLHNQKLVELLWNRYGDYDNHDIDSFLKNVGCTAMIVGHTPVDGAKLIGEKQLILSSSLSRGNKAYIVLDLEKKIRNAKEIMKAVKFLKDRKSVV